MSIYYCQDPSYNVNASDNNAGNNINFPWATWQKAFDTANAGDTVYFRGGTWRPTTQTVPGNIVLYDPSNGHGHNGTLTNPVTFRNYPGEFPILDCSLIYRTGTTSGLQVSNSNYAKFIGLQVKNVTQYILNQDVFGINFDVNINIYLENLVAHDTGGVGIYCRTFETAYIINCDSYNNYDVLRTRSGNNGDGFRISARTYEDHTYTYIYGCRSWNNADDGFDVGSVSPTDMINCWSFVNGKGAGGDGNGFKFAYCVYPEPSSRKMYNNIAAFNINVENDQGLSGAGFTEANLEDSSFGPFAQYYNNLAYKCKSGFTSVPLEGGYQGLPGQDASVTYRNNLVYASVGYGYEEQVNLLACNYLYPHYAAQDHNTWITKTLSNYWDYNPAVTVTDADFVALPTDTSNCIAILGAPRKSDGSLPDVSIFHLSATSDLKYAGVLVDVSLDGASYRWHNPPSMGAFEYYLTLVLSGSTYTFSNTDVNGVNIPRSEPTLLTFKNNRITCNSSAGYMLQCGTDGPGAQNNYLDNAIITGNYLDWNYPTTYQTGTTHGMMAGYNINYNIKYNYFDSPPYGIVCEGSSGMTYTSRGFSYNIFKNDWVFSILIAGQNNVPIYNNTFYSDVSTLSFINVKYQEQTDPYALSRGAKIKNNIFYAGRHSAPMYEFIGTDISSLSGFECDYNIYWNELTANHEPTFGIDNSSYTWTQWRALGYDTHSRVLNPSFLDTNDFIPSTALYYGTDLGATWNEGLDIDASWSATDPLTTTQSFYWQVGARTYDDLVIDTSIISLVYTVSASCGGLITSDGSFGIIKAGVCISTNINPTVLDVSTKDSSVVGRWYSSSLTGLNPSTHYHVRAYAYNSMGVAYGADVSFNTLPSSDGSIFFVAVDGSDSRTAAQAKNIATPWATFQKAALTAVAGDTVYFRGGVWQSTNAISIDSGYHSGSANNPIKFFNYPGETPIIDGTNVTDAGNYGIQVTSLNYLHIKGFTIRNFWQHYADQGCRGIILTTCTGITVENCVVYNNGGRGFHADNCNAVLIKNCDAYNICDYLTTTDPGGSGNGFNANSESLTDTVTFESCRAWGCSDQGFADFGFGGGHFIYVNCWSIFNGHLPGHEGDPAYTGDGNGFKPGLITGDPSIAREFYNCIAAFNDANGFRENCDSSAYARMNLFMYNNFSYYNKQDGFSVLNQDVTHMENQNIYRNNIGYKNASDYQFYSSYRDFGEHPGPSVEDHNSWDAPIGASPYIRSTYLTDADFVSLDVSQLFRPRKTNGALPDVSFGHITVNSSLKYTGVYVDACIYDGEGKLWHNPPSIGVFEYDSSTSDASAAPTVTTSSISSITSSTATGGGNVTHDGSVSLTYRGICWSTSPSPTTLDASTRDTSTGEGAYTLSLSSLNASTHYYVRAFAYNSQGTSYGIDVSFNTLSSSTNMFMMKSGANYVKWGNSYVAYYIR